MVERGDFLFGVGKSKVSLAHGLQDAQKIVLEIVQQNDLSGIVQKARDKSVFG